MSSKSLLQLLLISFALLILLIWSQKLFTFQVIQKRLSQLSFLGGPLYKKLKPPCSTNVFHEYFIENARFPEEGEWVNGTNTYSPDICTFSPYSLEACIRNKGYKSIFILGDSNGSKYFRALVEKFQHRGFICNTTKKEGKQVMKLITDRQYFFNVNSSLFHASKLGLRNCHCPATMMLCGINNSSSEDEIKLEYIGASSVRDASIGFNHEEIHTHYNVSEVRTFTDFLFKMYFQQTRYPDLMLLFVPFSHDKRSPFLLNTHKAIVKMSNYLVSHKPSHTEVYFMPTPSEFEEKRTVRKYRYAKYSGLLATDRIYKMNRLLFHGLQSVLLNSSYKIYGFMNMVNVSATKVSWNKDGVHYFDVWYEHVIDYIFSTACNSFGQ